MTDATSPTESGRQPSDEWLELIDQALLGLDHALNNRLAALRAFAELLRDDHWRATAAAGDSVQKELERLADTTRIVRLLARPKAPSRSGLIVEDVLADVDRIQSLLYDVRTVTIEFVSGPPLEPVWSDHASLVQLLSVLLYDLRKRTVGGNEPTVRVEARSDNDWITISLSACIPEGQRLAGDLAASLASRLGAECHQTASRLDLRLPTLKAHRALGGHEPAVD
jgi:C4-dicarboxylate-specific signal transduction histidine kinase